MKSKLSTRKYTVLKYFRTKAEHYDDVDHQLYWVLSDNVLWDLLNRLVLNDLQKKEGVKLLDAGAGTGRWGIKIAEKLQCETLLFDISKEMLAVARRKVEEKKLTKLIQIQEGDLERANSLKESLFDLSIALHNVLSFVDNPQNALTQMVKATKKGGYIIVIVANFYHALFFSNIACRFRELDRVIRKRQIKFTDEVTPMHTFTPTSLVSLFERCGVSSVNLYGFPVTIYPNMEETTLGQNSEFVSKNLTRTRVFKKILKIETEICLAEEAAARGNMLLAIGRK